MTKHEFEKDLTRGVEPVQELRRRYPVANQDVFEFLRSGHFRGSVTQAVNRARSMEQGFLLAYSEDQKFHVVWDKDVSEVYTRADWGKVEKSQWLPIGWIQFHPVSDVVGQNGAYVPSVSDLLHINPGSAVYADDSEVYSVGMFGGLIVPGRRLFGWAWESVTLSRQQIEIIYREWKNSFTGRVYSIGEDYYGDGVATRPMTYNDIDSLVSDLRDFGVNIHAQELDGNDNARSFASLVQGLDIKFGFLD